MLGLLFWVVVDAAVLFVAPPLVPTRYRKMAAKNALRVVGICICIIVFALLSTSYVSVPDGHLRAHSVPHPSERSVSGSPAG